MTSERNVIHGIFLAVGLYLDVFPHVFAQTGGGTFVGSGTCLEACHEGAEPRIRHRLSGKNEFEDPQWLGCESCHGPGSLHKEDGTAATILRPVPDSAEAFESNCLACHRDNSKVADFKSSRHKQKKVSCFDCHALHKIEDDEEGPEPKFLLKRSEPKLCFECHEDVREEMGKTYVHPAVSADPNEPGGVDHFIQCTACHNPHEARGTKPAKKYDPRCLKCHVDKDGGLAREHGAKYADGCVTCHVPHGSGYPGLLREPVILLCQSCHSAVNPSHDRTSASRGSCTTCHSHLHDDAYEGRFFK